MEPRTVNRRGRAPIAGRSRRPVFSEEKFRELLLYVSERCARDEKFGKTKLVKILYYSDFLAYGLFGHPITGATYQALEWGPVPRELTAVISKLKRTKQAVIVPRRYYNKTQQVPTPLRRPRLDKFSADEIALVDQVMADLWGENAVEVSSLSHLEEGYRLSALKRTIPYESVFLSSEPPTTADVRRAQELAARYGWLAPEKKKKRQA
jgi:uncharacterized phage-associated protein